MPRRLSGMLPQKVENEPDRLETVFNIA